MHKRIFTIMALLAAALLVKAAGAAATNTVTPVPATKAVATQAPPAHAIISTPPTLAEIDAVMKDGRYLATITLASGQKISVVLEGKYMPYTVANFVKLARLKFYNGLTFFRVLEQVQVGSRAAYKCLLSGDPKNDGYGNAGYSIPLEVSPYLHARRGAIVMFYRGAPSRASSQFLLTATDMKLIDGQYAIFGWVKDGLAVLDKIKLGDQIKTITVARYPGKESCPLFALPMANKWIAATKSEEDAMKTHGRSLATITFNNGKQVQLVLEDHDMPGAAANFIKLAHEKFYDGLSLSSNGGPVMTGGDLNGEDAGFDVKIDPNRYVNPAGAMGLLPSSDPSTGGSRFYITLSEVAQLNGKLFPFGWVRANGLDVLKQVKPNEKLTIKTLTISDYNGTEANPLIAATPSIPPHVMSRWTPPTPGEINETQTQGRYLATITMANGKSMQVVLEGKIMPGTVANFVKLIQAKFYDGLTFHRVEHGAGFQLIQGGSPTGDGSGNPGYFIRFEKSNLIHKAGAIAMARSDALDSAGCQFYICLCDIPDLDSLHYAVFGWVKSGLDVAIGIKPGDKMKSVTVQPYTGGEACPVMATGPATQPAATRTTPTPPVTQPAATQPAATQPTATK